MRSHDLHHTRIEELVQGARHRHKTAVATFGERDYLRLTDGYRALPRGTAVFGPVTVVGYPGIGRILALGQGLRGHFHGPFWAEEKVNGYNVRIFRLGDEILALTRGGFVCPFTSDRVPDLMDTRVFEHQPDLVVCAEVAGPEQPYLESTPSFVAGDLQLFVFDFMRLNRTGFLPQKEGYALLDEYALGAVQRFGRYTPGQTRDLQVILRRVNAEGREGLVFKEDSGRRRTVKYVTSGSAVSDIRTTAEGIADLPPEFFTNRILRLALYLEEQGVERTPELDRALGASFLDGLGGAIRQFQREKKVYHRFRCRFREQHNALAFIQHMDSVGAHQVQINWQDLRFEGGYWVLEFDKLYSGFTGLLANLLSGGIVYD